MFSGIHVTCGVCSADSGGEIAWNGPRWNLLWSYRDNTSKWGLGMVTPLKMKRLEPKNGGGWFRWFSFSNMVIFRFHLSFQGCNVMSCSVLTSKFYPRSFGDGDPLKGLGMAPSTPDSLPKHDHPGTRKNIHKSKWLLQFHESKSLPWKNAFFSPFPSIQEWLFGISRMKISNSKVTCLLFRLHIGWILLHGIQTFLGAEILLTWVSF